MNPHPPSPSVVEAQERFGARLRMQRADASAVPALDLRMAVSQVETNVALDDTAFSVEVPADAAPMTLDELRASGPLRDAVSAKTP